MAADLQETIKDCLERLDRHRRPNQRVGEQNTKVMLVEPVLKALGWDLFNPDEVNREYRRRGSDNPVDYALLLLRTPRLFVEAKGLGENLDDPRWANQTISYAAVAGVEWVALTDGAHWRIYNAHAPVPVEEKLFRTADLHQDPENAADVLQLLSKDNMRENRIQELWQGFFVDRQVHNVLTGLFTGTEPANDLVTLIAKRAERLTKDAVRASLVRARATFDFPPATLGDRPLPSAHVSPAPRRPRPPATLPAPGELRGSPPAEDVDRRGTSPDGPPVRRVAVSAAERALKVTDLVRLGRLRAGPLTARYDGREWRAQLGADGTITVNGVLASSLSKAGESVR